MPRLRDNLLANYVGHAWVALMGLIFVPLYLRLLGPEAFGLIALMLSLQAISLALDLGIGSFMGREIARRLDVPERRATIRSLVKSFEAIVWPIATCIGITFAASSGSISAHWLELEKMSAEETHLALLLIAFVIALGWPTGFYSAALAGLERQRSLNVIVVVFATFRFAGVLPILYAIDERLIGFLVWHAALALAQTTITGCHLHKVMPQAGKRPLVSVAEIFAARKFAFGVFTVSGLGILLSQFDRLTLSALRPLEELGYFTVVASLSGGLGRLVQPVFNAIYPRMSRLIEAGDASMLSNLHRLASQLVAAVVATIASLVCMAPTAVLMLWTGDIALAERLAPTLTLLFAGSAVNALLSVPYALQLAHGWVRLATSANLVAVLVAIPLFSYAVARHGMLGAAATWLLLNLGQFVLVVPVVLHRLLHGESARWYLYDLTPPIAAAIIVGWTGAALAPSPARGLTSLTFAILVPIFAFAAAVFAAPDLRRWILTTIKTRSVLK